MNEEKIKKGRYLHYKGNEYEVLHVAHHSESLEDMVVYRALYGKREVWCRPASMWNETVSTPEGEKKRFSYIGPALTLRPFSVEDADFVLALNEENVEFLAPMDRKKLFDFARMADRFYICEADGERAAFLIALSKDATEYDSENYLWFKNKYESFLYIDRIVIAEKHRKNGIGRFMYNRVLERARDLKIPVVCAEIDTVPYNGASLAFHEKMGFAEVGEQFVRGGTVKVSLQSVKTE